MRGSGYSSRLVTLFKDLKSIHRRKSSFTLRTKTIGEAQLDFDSSIQSSYNNSSISFLMNSSSCEECLYGGLAIGSASLVNSLS